MLTNSFSPPTRILSPRSLPLPPCPPPSHPHLANPQHTPFMFTNPVLHRSIFSSNKR